MTEKEMPQEVFDLAFNHLISVYGWPVFLARVDSSIMSHAAQAEKDGDAEMAVALTTLAGRTAFLADWAKAMGL